MGNYIFIQGLYDTLDLFSDELKIELEKIGHHTLTLRLSTMEEDLEKMLFCYRSQKIDAVITFNNLGYNLGESEGANLWDTMQVPYVNILMDHPFHFHEQLLHAPNQSIICCIDRNHVDYIHRYYPNIKRVHILAHAGCANAIEREMPRERDIDVLYAGNLSRVLIEQLIPDFESMKELDGGTFSREVLQQLLEQPSLTTEEAIRETLQHYLPIETMQSEREYMNSFRFLDGFATSFYREMAVRILVENGIRVHVLGIGWEKCDWANHENLILEGKVCAPEVLSYMQRSKIILNSLTWFKAGAHDRIFNGMLSGACVISDTSSYLQEKFADNKEPSIMLYELENTKELPAITKRLLNDNTLREEVASRGRIKAQQQHTWGNRLQEIFSILQ